MNRNRRLSDQLSNWSDNDKASSEFAPAARRTHRTAPVNQTGAFTGVTYRAVQKMRQARVQMYEWTRARSQILPFGKYFGSPARDDLHTTGVCGASTSVSWKSRASANYSRRDLPNQHRTSKKSRRTRRVNKWRRDHLSLSTVLIYLRPAF